MAALMVDLSAASMAGQWDLWESTMADLLAALSAALTVHYSAVLMAGLSVDL